jgi:transcriptional regulator GlxA family with amidase domain
MDQRVAKVVKFMEMGISKPLSINNLATAVNLSPWRLCHIFKNEMRATLVQYLRELRMRQARSLLETTFLSVKEIRTKVGIRDESHFVRDFQKIYGMSPSRFRLSLSRTPMKDSPVARFAKR